MSGMGWREAVATKREAVATKREAVAAYADRAATWYVLRFSSEARAYACTVRTDRRYGAHGVYRSAPVVLS